MTAALPAPGSPDFDCKIACPYIDEGSIGRLLWVAPKLTSLLTSYKLQMLQDSSNYQEERKEKDKSSTALKTSITS